MRIIVKKISRYKYGSDEKISDFEYASLILNQTLNPKTLEPNSLYLPNIPLVYVSSLARAVSCIKKTENQKIMITENLREIPFDIKKYINESAYKKEASKAVRKAFIRAFIDDDLLVSRERIFKQIELLLKRIKKTKLIKVGLVSHSFRMKVLQAYIETNGQIKNNPKLIKQFIKVSEKTFEFKEGFDFKI